MIITTWIVYVLARKGVGFPFPPKTSSDIEVVESEAVSVVQHWLKKTEEEASQGIKEKMSNNYPPTHGQDIHVTRDVVKHRLSKSDLLANLSQEVLEERTRIQFIRWSHTRIFQVPSEVRECAMRDRIEQVRRRGEDEPEIGKLAKFSSPGDEGPDSRLRALKHKTRLLRRRRCDRASSGSWIHTVNDNWKFWCRGPRS
ncbi:spermatogenesis-associated protein 19, mitochondrial [Orycteropus afer afer]|uniref:Spermatogenesis-associated protein 19, mitochondrial n=1 Tax=Orycteropus afer afer TaxID=1230840 RepID=A0AC54Z4R1_ORYAF|nr:spermatogenesis-associated protein 19, mitochondrial [Orycteropus afer afer]